MADCYQVLPTGPDTSEMMTFRVAPPDDRRAMKAARYLSDRITRGVVREDFDFCRWTNAGVRSGRYAGGLLSDYESGVRFFRDKLRELIPVAGLRERPVGRPLATVNAQLRVGANQDR